MDTTLKRIRGMMPSVTDSVENSICLSNRKKFFSGLPLFLAMVFGILRAIEFEKNDLQGISWQSEQRNLALLKIQILFFADILNPSTGSRDRAIYV